MGPSAQTFTRNAILTGSNKMPILLWLVGIPIPLIILILLLR